MHVVWSKSIRTSNPWEPEYFGVFHKKDNDITFFFKDKTNLLAISAKDREAKTIYSCRTGERLSLPREWAVVEDSGISFLLISKDKGVDLENNVFSSQIPVQAQLAYNNHIRKEKYYEETPYCFGEYTIIHKGNCGYICKKNGSKIWEFVGKAYLYTDIVRWNDRLIFGTAGNSGHFYVLNIENGEPLICIKTGGTKNFVQIDNLCYVLSNSKNAQLLCIDLSNCKTISQCDLPGIATSNSKLTIEDNHIQTITFEFTKSQLKGAIWSCLEM